MDWWWDAVDAACEKRPVDLSIVMPCFGKTISLNDLDYEMPAGFARFVIVLDEPSLLEDEEVEWLEDELGFTLKQVKATY